YNIMVGVNEDNKLGYLFWFSIGSTLINRDDLYDKLVKSGLGSDWMPNDIKYTDAFRRATSEVQGKRKSKYGESYFNLLVREVQFNQTTVQRNIVLETINRKKRELNYANGVGVVKLDRQKGKMTSETNDPIVEAVSEEIEEKNKLYSNNYRPEAIRALIPKVLKLIAPLPMRNSGGIYFIPTHLSEGTRELVDFINSLEDSEAYLVPISHKDKNTNMVAQRLSKYINGLLDQAEDVS